MRDLVASLGPWAWIIAGLVLTGLEVLAPGAFMLWLGLAAIATGMILFVAPMSWEFAGLLFAALAIAAVLVGRRVTRSGRSRGETALNNRGGRIVGRTFVLESPIAEGRGRLRVDDTIWRIVGPDLPAGAQVRVTGVEGTLLRVVGA